ncbi:MAG: 23S rRNA (adenine(2503)-C(2))-methyltransferase RlmN [Sedimentisphaerales bacterium]
MGKDLKSKTVAGLERLVVGLDQAKYLAGYIFSAIQAHSVTDISAITTLSKPLRVKLVEEGYYISSLRVIEKLTDPDGTVKYVFGLPDGGRVESVLLFDDDRRTLCVSTQVGCGMGCVFCATGRLGLARNLTAGEIVDQVNVAGGDTRPVRKNPDTELSSESQISNGARISNVVFMGMGEPLANYEATLDAVRILNHSAGRHIGIRHLTISTCGLVEGIERLADEDIQPRLAISLNAPTDAIRQKLMPIAKKYSLGRLFAAVELYQRKTRNRVTFEYCLIKGVNDTVLHAQMLIRRLRAPLEKIVTRNFPTNRRFLTGRVVMCNVNLIEYNPYLGCGLKPSGREAIERFAGVLEDAGIETTVRLKMGQTINAACGQLGAKR